MGTVNIYLTILLISLLNSIVNSWHNKIEFDFIAYKNESKELKLFESIYLNHDYFSLLSSTRNNYFDLNNDKKVNSIFIGARYEQYFLHLCF